MLENTFVGNMWDDMIERERSKSTSDSRLNALKRNMTPIHWSKTMASDTSANGCPRNVVIATPNAHDKGIRIKKNERISYGLFGQALWTGRTRFFRYDTSHMTSKSNSSLVRTITKLQNYCR